MESSTLVMGCGFLQVYAQEWNTWVIVYLFLFSGAEKLIPKERIVVCSPQK